MCGHPSHQSIKQVKRRLGELGVSESITPLVLKQLAENKALSTIGGRSNRAKRTDITTRQGKTGFARSQRGHARSAAKKMQSDLDGLERGLLGFIRSYQNGDLSYRRLASKSNIAFKGTAEKIFQYGMKAAGLVGSRNQLYQLSASEKRWLTSYMREELGYFKKFLEQIKAGSQKDSTIKTRVKRYVDSMRSIYEAGRILSVGTEVLIWWTLESDNPCPDCREIAKYNPYTPKNLPTTPKGGQTRCLFRCYCTLRIEKATKEQVRAAEEKNPTAAQMIKRLRGNQRRRT